MARTAVQKLSWVGDVLTIVYPKVGRTLVVDTSEFPQANRDHARRHGYHQRFGDLESGDRSGSAKVEAAEALRDWYKGGGEWRMQAERDTLAELVEAVHKVLPEFSCEQLRLAADAEPEQVADWREDARVRNEIAKARAKKAAERAKAAPKQDLVVRGLK